MDFGWTLRQRCIYSFTGADQNEKQQQQHHFSSCEAVKKVGGEN